MEEKGICRACLGPCGPKKIAIFTKQSTVLSGNWNKFNLKNFQLKISILDLNFFQSGHLKPAAARDLLPKWLCNDCATKLEASVKFLRQILESHEELLRLRKTSRVESLGTRKSPRTKEVSEVIQVSDDERGFSPEIPEEPEETSECLEKPVLKKVFHCDQCNRQFNSKFRLKCHIRIHSGERPYQCKTCGQNFRQLNALNVRILLTLNGKKINFFLVSFESSYKRAPLCLYNLPEELLTKHYP